MGSAGKSAEFVELLAAPRARGGVVEMLRVEVAGPVDWRELLRAWRHAG
jgi:hypothetical protein